MTLTSAPSSSRDLCPLTLISFFILHLPSDARALYLTSGAVGRVLISLTCGSKLRSSPRQ
ncbi:hypothetical protein PVAP13_3KG563003 [Panicum virgatum]|uniref:Uncharacterized protein n=1 Tax=Panicum virgatum TaxID=38727 RepID=A0A8T0V386_PANVG|nr:hypothetical protein PVAP13_3KG563003 [Panicum virgatum]